MLFYQSCKINNNSQESFIFKKYNIKHMKYKL